MLTNGSRDRKATSLYILTGLNLLTGVLLILFLYLIRIAIKGFAAGLILWPLFVLVPLGAAESLTAVLAARKVEAQGLRIAGFVINGFTLSVYSVFICVAVGWFVLIPRVHYVVPQGYVGDVYVIHNVAGAEAAKRTFWGVRYEIPKDGILLTQAPVLHGAYIPSYYYRNEGGGLQRIGNLSPLTKAENPPDDKDVVAYFPRTGLTMTSIRDGVTGSSIGCRVEYEQFTVGTRAYISSHHVQRDLQPYLQDHPEVCGGQHK
jgi:hypothetical protein